MFSERFTIHSTEDFLLNDCRLSKMLDRMITDRTVKRAA